MIRIGSEVNVTKSELGRLYGAGKVKNIYGETVIVEFKDTIGKTHLGQYNKSKVEKANG